MKSKENVKKKIMVIGGKSLGLQVSKKVFELSKKYGQDFAGIVTYDDRNSDRSKFKEIFDFTKEMDVPLFIVKMKPKKESNQMLNNVIENIKPDIIIMANWYWILPEDVIKLVKDGIYCLHAAPLPKGRGFAPLNWAIILGFQKTAVTIFKVVPELDAGPIVCQNEVKIFFEDNIRTLYERVENEYLKCLDNIWQDLVNGKITFIQNDGDDWSFFGKRIPEDGEINWEWNSKKLYDFIRAQVYPYPGAFTFLKDTKLIIEEVEIVEEDDIHYFGTPGQILKIVSDGVYVKCGRGTLKIKTIRLKENTNETLEARKILKSLNYRLLKKRC